VSRRDRQRLDDIQAALDAIDQHLARGELSDGLVSDAVRVRLIEIGEAVKGLSAVLLATGPDLPWAQKAGMRDRLAHRDVDNPRHHPRHRRPRPTRPRRGRRAAQEPHRLTSEPAHGGSVSIGRGDGRSRSSRRGWPGLSVRRSCAPGGVKRPRQRIAPPQSPDRR
jgi:hypothetical protein